MTRKSVGKLIKWGKPASPVKRHEPVKRTDSSKRNTSLHRSSSYRVAAKRSSSLRRVTVRRASCHDTADSLELDDFMKVHDWTSVRCVLKLPRGINAAEKIDFDSGHSSLSLAVSLGAPADIIGTIISMNPSAVGCADLHQRLPIHVACSSGASAEVSKSLLVANLETALYRDEDGRLPLHYAVEYCVGTYGHDYGWVLDSVEALCEAAPEAVSQRDNWGDTPADIAKAAEENAKMENDPEVGAAAEAVHQILQKSIIGELSKEKDFADT